MSPFFFFFFFFSLLSLVLAVPLAPRDVWVPPITTPDAHAIWVVGGTFTVAWDTTTQPAQVTNPEGKVYLRRNGATQSTPLVEGFPLAAGQVQVTIPKDTEPADDWIVVLFGDSGNWSPEFSITSA